MQNFASQAFFGSLEGKPWFVIDVQSKLEPVAFFLGSILDLDVSTMRSFHKKRPFHGARLMQPVACELHAGITACSLMNYTRLLETADMPYLSNVSKDTNRASNHKSASSFPDLQRRHVVSKLTT